MNVSRITIAPMTPVRMSGRQVAHVPLLGVITAGKPLPNPEEIAAEAAETVEVPSEIAPAEKLKDVYALQVRGQSMIDALIDDGDIVLLRYQETAENGQMVAARIREENAVTLKKMLDEPVTARMPAELVERFPDLAGIVATFPRARLL